MSGAAELPTCGGCGLPLERVLEQAYGFWEWHGAGYEWTFVTVEGTSRVAMFVCARCMTPTPFHPIDIGIPVREGKTVEGGNIALPGAVAPA